MIVCAQLAAFGRVSKCREAGEEKARMKKERPRGISGVRKVNRIAVCMNGNGHANESVERSSGTPQHHQDSSCPR